ncbi:hypothetical protein lerEdw1_019982 [Lerista edwardsae]|nr:hypothetical protein lerEdw1_019982 [Lerista edwardsae]
MEPSPAAAAAAATPGPSAAATPSVGSDRLFDSHRLPSDGLLLLSLLLYAPVGLCLLLLRLFIGLHVFLVSCALPDSAPRRFIVRVMCSVLGLFVRQSNPWQRSLRARVYIANHVTHFDHNIINLLTSCSAFVAVLHLGHSSASGPSGSETFCRCGECAGPCPAVVQWREERVSLVPVGLGPSPLPPFFPLPRLKSVADASWVVELLWAFFVPFTIYQVRWLPSVYRPPEKTREDFAWQVQERLALELGVVSTRLTAADKAEHLKRLRHSPPASHTPAPSQPSGSRPPQAPPSVEGPPTEDAHLMDLAQRVKEVLPHVPLAVILKDLGQTSCVDATIANLLEGRVPFTPCEAEASLPAPSDSSAQRPMASSPVMVPVKVFARSPEARHLSLQERKRALYDQARR